MLLIYIFINEAAQFEPSTYASATQHVFDRAPCVLVMVFAILASLGISYLIRDYLFVVLFETFYEHFGGLCAVLAKESAPLENKAILRKGETAMKKNKYSKYSAAVLIITIVRYPLLSRVFTIELRPSIRWCTIVNIYMPPSELISYWPSVNDGGY